MEQYMDIDAITTFWAEIARNTIDWFKPWASTLSGDLVQGQIAWFKGGSLNVSYNCLDRHLATKAMQPAIIWQGDAPNEQRILSFAELHSEVCRMSHVLKQLDIQKGDKVAIYLPMIPEAAMAMLACARIGAVHTVIFAGFSAQALRQRLLDSECKCLITTATFNRGGKPILLSQQVQDATSDLAIQRLWIETPKGVAGKTDHAWQGLKTKVDDVYPPEPMDAEDPLFILYTSGSTGQPKGLVHTTGGYLVQVAYTHQLLFNCGQQEVFWCTADVGWITGHSYVVYGPLCQGVTTLMYEGVPSWPDASRYWQIIDKYHVNVFYTAPTAIRSLMRFGDEPLASSSRASLRLLGTVGEPINPEAWRWYAEKVGGHRCPIVDTSYIPQQNHE
jgi:acetyl-CoA synthetase